MDEQAIRDTARCFVAGAFAALREEHVIPTPIYHPYVAVGRDYFGDTIHSLPDYRELERLLDEAYPERFADPLSRRHAEFASPGAMADLALWSGRYVARTLFASDIVLTWPSLSSETSRSCSVPHKRSTRPLACGDSAYSA